MAVKASSRVSKAPKRLKTGTASLNHHRFESFTQRIAKLKIDPTSKSRRTEIGEDDLDSTTSHFGNELSEWKELNLSEGFTKFVQEIQRFCGSLPLILHHQDEIAECLFRYLDEENALFLEPILCLISRFAQDIGARFEKYFERALSSIARIASSHADIEVIEWSFSCLAWLFKHLSRLLTPDLRPTYTILAPLLGKKTQKPHIARFAAEAMSFLLRKAVSQHRAREPLDLIVSHSLNDFYAFERSEQSADFYRYGVMNLYSNALRGINQGLHSSATTIFTCLLENEISRDSRSISIGVLINIIHHTNSLSFQPLLDIVLDFVYAHGGPLSTNNEACSEILFAASSARKGSRIGDWKRLIDSLIMLQFQETNRIENSDQSSWFYKAVAVIFQYAPLDLVIGASRKIMDRAVENAPPDQFLSFCVYFDSLGKDRFQSLLLPYFYKYVNIISKHDEGRSLEAMLQICTTYATKDKQSDLTTRVVPMPWLERGLSQLEQDLTPQKLWLLNAYLSILDLIPANKLSTSILDNLSKRLQPDSNKNDRIQNLDVHSASAMQKFINGRLLSSINRISSFNSKFANTIDHDYLGVDLSWLWMPRYIDNLCMAAENHNFATSERDRRLLQGLSENLTSPSKALRESSLKLLEIITSRFPEQSSLAISTLLSIESTPLTLQSVRIISMHIRKLPGLFTTSGVPSWQSRAITCYLFGLLTFKLSPIWADAIQALKEICENAAGEEIVWDIAFQWLAHGNSFDTTKTMNSISSKNQYDHANEFQCTNTNELQSEYLQIETRLCMTEKHFQERFDSDHIIAPLVSERARVQALKVLSGISWVAEKKSRQLVPLLLSWTDQGDSSVFQASMSSAESRKCRDNEEATPLPPTRSERQALVDLFGCFTNPRVLYKSDDVFQTLLKLLTNGDSGMQKAALKAIFTWKISGIKPYQESLMNILDDARFREELSIFLQTENEDGLRPEHKPDLMPVLLRLLYGKITSKSSSSNNTSSQKMKRRAVLEGLGKFEDNDLHSFFEIALGPLKTLLHVTNDNLASCVTLLSSIPPRRILGALNMIRDMVDILGGRLSFLVAKMVHCIMRVAEYQPSMTEANKQQNTIHKDVRSMVIQCLDLLFARCTSEELLASSTQIFNVLIRPRLDKFAIETAQSISGLLRLFATWSSHEIYAPLLTTIEPSILDKISDILPIPSAKDPVKLFVINNILLPLIQRSTSPKEFDTEPSLCAVPELEELHVYHMLNCANLVLEGSPSKILLSTTIELVSNLSSIVTAVDQAQKLLGISSFLLSQPIARVHAKTKGDLLRIITDLIPRSAIVKNDKIFYQLFVSISSLFKYFKDRTNRQCLCAALKALATVDEHLLDVAFMCQDLNAYSTEVIDSPDFERRRKAFSQISESSYLGYSERQWTPMVFNLLFYLQDEDELATRSSASLGLQRFVDACSHSGSTQAPAPAWTLLTDTLLPALREGASAKSELVRSEYLVIMAQVVRKFPQWEEIHDMEALLVNDDDEASFFTNILHVQQHRRLRALRRLSGQAEEYNLRSTNVAHFFMPMLEHFILSQTEDPNAHNLISESSLTIAALASCMEWPQLRAILRRYVGYISTKPDFEKVLIRVSGLLIDKLGRAAATKKDHLLSTASFDNTRKTESISIHGCLVRTLPQEDRLGEELIKTILPPLMSYIHNKDESTVSLRVPVAVSAVKLLKVLPQSQFTVRLPPLLTDVCHILRSRAQESRDMTRKTLVDITALIGPKYLGFVLKELRSSLARGYQLHVLSYTLHSILVSVADVFPPGSLDYCLQGMVTIIMDDIFGTTGQEKDAEEYVSKMKEVKSSKSFDSMELLAKSTSICQMSALIDPLQALLQEKIDIRIMKKVDELLRRIGHGLLRNEAVGTQQTLVFCYEIIQGAYKGVQQHGMSKIDHRVGRFLVDTKGQKFAHSTQATLSYRYKLTRFSFDVLRMILKKHDSLRTPKYIVGFIPAIGDALLHAHEEVQMASLRLIAEIIDLEMPELERNANIYVSEAVKIIKNAVSTNTEISQAAFKLVTAVLREKNQAIIKETDVGYLLKKVKNDLEEADRQGITFNFLKAVLKRRVVITELYEIMDSIAIIMVTSHSKTTRDMARGAYFEFLVNFPHSQNRLSKQINFLVKNLDYKHEEGRRSIMEAMYRLVSKAPYTLLQDISNHFFVPLVLSTVNDEALECRKMASALLKTLMEKCNEDSMLTKSKLMKIWIAQSDQPLLVRSSLQLYGILCEVNQDVVAKEFSWLQEQLDNIFRSQSDRDSTNWELLYYALQLQSKLVAAFPQRLLSSGSEDLWISIRGCLSYQHTWVKHAAAKLLGIYFADIARQNAKKATLDRPLRGEHGVTLSDEEMCLLMKSFLRCFKVPRIGEDLATQLARNIVFLGQFLCHDERQGSQDSDEDDKDTESAEETFSDANDQEKTPLGFLFRVLASVLKRELLDNKSPSLIAKTAAVKIIGSLISKLPVSNIQIHLRIILLALMPFTDPNFRIPFSTDEKFSIAYQSIVDSSQEIIGSIQKRIEASSFIQEVSVVRTVIKERREARRIKRAVERVTDPERTAKQKRRKVEREKARKKERIAEFRGRRRGW